MVVIQELQVDEASSGTISDHRYEVLLSFRGIDTRLGFTDHLYKALVEADINTFRDDEGIETGDHLKPELERAITQSRASIIVLSKNYASSTWCLNELLMILEQRRNFEMIVLPIFYHVDPSHVRRQEDSFADAMKKHENDLEAETDLGKKQQRTDKLKLWKEALTEVANLKGKDVKGWHETTFIQQIVTEIDHRLDRKVSRTSQDLIGRSFQVQEIEFWLKDGSVKDVDFLTICGIGGIGKTALARYIYDKNFGLFERSCFLENISTSVIRYGKLSLQKQLLKDIKGKQDISRVNEGTSMIEKALMRKRVLLVLDDVDKVDQLDALLGTKGFFPGSKIIITTRDRLLPKKCEVWNAEVSSNSEHLLEGLGMNESLELLSRHAFRCNSPKEGYEEPSRKVVNYCGGHPLALQVLGSSLFEKDVAVWEDTLELLEKEINPNIQSVLKISFDSLESENDKKLFKYIACFFVGKHIDYIKKVLKECDIRTSSGIPNLIDKCLLNVDFCKCVKMHQLLQEMGRHIVHQESLLEPCERSILCCHEESFNVLKEEKGTDKIQGLLLDMQMLEKKLGGYHSAKEENFEDDPHKNSRTLTLLGWFRTFIPRFWWLFGWLFLLCSKFYPDKGNLKTEAFTKMNNLALLQLNFVQLTGSYEKFPRRLRWLCWHGFPSQYIPPDLPMANLVALDMSHSNLERLWKTPKSLAWLKILDLSGSVKLIRTGDLSGLPNLEQLIMARCGNLVEICESIGELHGLALLDLRYCVKLRKLPRNMRKIKTLLLGGCSNLFKTSAHETRTMEVVPRSPQSSWLLLLHSIGKLALARNDLCNESFPIDFSSLSSLVELDLSENLMDSLPDCVRSLVRLERLNMLQCKNLKSVLSLPSTITRLDVKSCKSLEKITLHSARSEAPRIAYFLCDKLMEAEGYFKMEPIEKVGKEITNRLGWSGLHFLEPQEVITNNNTTPSPLMMYEFGIFSACLSDNQVPHWFTYKTSGTWIWFTVPQSPNNHRIRGLNVCFLWMMRDFPVVDMVTKISNMTKNLTWIYGSDSRLIKNHFHWGKEQRNRQGVLVSHWIFENNELEVGDEIYVSNENVKVGRDCWGVKECGIEPVYDEHNNELQEMATDPLDYYKSWTRTICGGISHFHFPSGSYFLDNHTR